MTDLVALISSGKGTIAHVAKLIEGEQWEKVFLITTVEFKNEVPKKDNVELIIIDNKKMLIEIIEDLKKDLRGKLRIMDTAVNIISGEGKEHMALLSALVQLGIGIRFMALTKDGVREV
jgi:hypothetical protein